MCVGIVILVVVAVSSAQNLRNADAIREHYSVQHPAEFERAYRGESQQYGDSQIGAENREQQRINGNINERNRPSFEEGYHYNKPELHHHHEHHREFHHHPRHSNNLPSPPQSPDFNIPHPPRVDVGPGKFTRPPLQNNAGNQYEEANQRNVEHFEPNLGDVNDHNNKTVAESRTNIENKTSLNVEEKRNESHQTVNQNARNSNRELTKTNQSVLVQNVTNNTRNANVTGVEANETVTVNVNSLLPTNISRNASNSTDAKHLLNSKRPILQQRKQSGNNETENEEQWSWGVADVEVTTMSTTVVTLDDRAAFSGNNCPTGMAKVLGQCVEVH